MKMLFDWLHREWTAAAKRAGMADRGQATPPQPDQPVEVAPPLLSLTDVHSAVVAMPGERPIQTANRLYKTGKLPDHTQRQPAVRKQEI